MSIDGRSAENITYELNLLHIYYNFIASTYHFYPSRAVHVHVKLSFLCLRENYSRNSLFLGSIMHRSLSLSHFDVLTSFDDHQANERNDE